MPTTSAGCGGVVDEADVKSGKVPIIAPVGFMEHAMPKTFLPVMQ
jgi:alkyl sulfatase BDS1-like metallo-beta-lactamase superfamily hydrolase